MSNEFDKVAEFNNTFGHAVRDVPSLEYPDVELRLRIFEEEAEELRTALNEKDEVEFLDALGDVLVTLYGLAQATGMPIIEAFNIIHDSNMSKLGEDGLPIYYPHGHEKAGKIAKGPNFYTPTQRLTDLIKEKKNGRATNITEERRDS